MIAIITSQFNEAVTEKLYKGAIDRLKELNISEQEVASFWVPGAIEIPLVARQLAKSERYRSIIALGAVIRGETGHYDYVCKQVSDGCQQVSLQYDIPVIFGVLTTDDAKQALARAGGGHGNKGVEAVDAAMSMMQLMEQIT